MSGYHQYSETTPERYQCFSFFVLTGLSLLLVYPFFASTRPFYFAQRLPHLLSVHMLYFV